MADLNKLNSLWDHLPPEERAKREAEWAAGAEERQKRMMKQIEPLRKQLEHLKHLPSFLSMPPMKMPLGIGDPGAVIRNAMRSDREAKAAARRRARRAIRLAPDFLLWAYRQHRSGVTLIIGTDFGRTMDTPRCDATLRIIGTAVRDGLFTITDGQQEVDEHLMIEQAERLADGEADDRGGITATVQFTPKGLKASRRLKRSRLFVTWFGWTFPVARATKHFSYWLAGAVGFLLAAAIFWANVVEKVPKFWKFVVDMFQQFHGSTQP